MFALLALSLASGESLRIEDRTKISDLLTRYATAVDRMDWQLYRSLFTKDAVVDYTAAGGSVGTPQEISEWMAGVFEGPGQ